MHALAIIAKAPGGLITSNHFYHLDITAHLEVVDHHGCHGGCGTVDRAGGHQDVLQAVRPVTAPSKAWPELDCGALN